MRVLVTGGAGYIGSHTLVELLAGGHDALVVDNYANSAPAALDQVARLSNRRFARLTCDLRDAEAINVGTGRGVSVRELVRTFEQVSGRRIPCEVAPRRPGDVAVSVADASKAQALLGWHAELGLAEMCRSAWEWQSRNPQGYAG